MLLTPIRDAARPQLDEWTAWFLALRGQVLKAGSSGARNLLEQALKAAQDAYVLDWRWQEQTAFIQPRLFHVEGTPGSYRLEPTLQSQALASTSGNFCLVVDGHIHVLTAAVET